MAASAHPQGFAPFPPTEPALRPSTPLPPSKSSAKPTDECFLSDKRHPPFFSWRVLRPIIITEAGPTPPWLIERSMTTVPQTLPEEAPESRMQEIQATLRKLEKRDWWLWSLAIVVMLLLTLAVVSLSFPSLMKFEDPFFQFSLNQSVRGLVGLVLLFNTYTIYQQVMMRRLRRQLSEQLNVMSRLQARAEEFHKQATMDALTGLYNRRFAERCLAAEAARSRRYGHPLALLAIDLNDFKQI